WNLQLNIGVSKSYLDLREFCIGEVELNTGITNIFLKLGDKSDYSEINVEMGVSMLEIQIPKSSGCRINYDLHVVDSNIDGFEKKDSEVYLTENFEAATKKIDINVEGGVTSFKVIRY
ncbi:MAG: hypothetical protein JW866_02370, partial [Ignavibacteriales bacterium]|nr:hypothetical protein [Ignavibacteriales bacterium]